jgi:hypothetical protein
MIDLMMVKRQLFKDLLGFNISYGDQLSYVDFCLRAKLRGHAVVYAPESEGVNFEGEEGETEDDATTSWGSDTEIQIFSAMYVNNTNPIPKPQSNTL